METIINKILDVEGGYVNDPKDRGGETNHGITKKVARYFGYDGDMKDLTREQAIFLYKKQYFKPLHVEEINLLSPLIALKVADIGVNMGISRAGFMLQDTLNRLNGNDNLVLDGKVGPNTIKVLAKAIESDLNEEIIFKMLNTFQAMKYLNIASNNTEQHKFLRGWFNKRVR